MNYMCAVPYCVEYLGKIHVYKNHNICYYPGHDQGHFEAGVDMHYAYARKRILYSVLQVLEIVPI